MDTKHINNLPDWRSLRNEVGNEFNQFCILRGRDFIQFGDDVWIGYFCVIDGSGGLTIGSRVSLSSGVHIYTHDSSFYRAYGLPKKENGDHIDRKPVFIGNNVQIGANSVVLPGVVIGDNVVIGACSLVNRDIPSNTVAVGNPCKVIKKHDNK